MPRMPLDPRRATVFSLNPLSACIGSSRDTEVSLIILMGIPALAVPPEAVGTCDAVSPPISTVAIATGPQV